MTKGKLVDGDPFYIINISQYVTKAVFASALADYCWEGSEIFDPKMTRREGMRILKHRLEWAGRQGIDTTLWEGASEDFVQPHNDAYEAAIAWIETNYPYLNK